MSPFFPYTGQQIKFAPCRACEIEANDEQVKQMPMHTCGKDGPIERAELKQAIGSVAAPKDGEETPSSFKDILRFHSINTEYVSAAEKWYVTSSPLSYLEAAFKMYSANELSSIRDTLRQRDELIKETTIHDKNGKMIKEGDRVKERLVDFSNDLGYIDVFYTVKWDRWCYCLFIHDKWIKPLDTITSNNIEIA